MRTGILRRFLLAAFAGLGFVWPALADPAVTTAPATMRRAPNPHAHIVQTIPPNAQIDLSNCSGDWCYASWRNLFGYIPAFAVAQAGPPSGAFAPLPPPVVVAAPPVVVGPAWGWGGPCVGASWGYERRW
jgi:hypothetical protein